MTSEVDAAPGRFEPDGNRWQFAGTLTFRDAGAVFTASEELPLPASGIVDLRGLVHADSSALAVLLALKRRAAAEKVSLSFEAMPAALDSLARVYGVEPLLLS
ncbi:MAG: STAS domain-containing protein [Casimicrobiaceae bacterium]